MSYQLSVRLSIISMALFPTLWGIFSFMNNTSGFDGTLQYAVAPMLAMTDTYGNPAQTWRAISSPYLAQIALVLITSAETLAGLLGVFSIFKMLKALKQPFANFQKAKVPLIFSCLLAILVWGVGFMVVAGDYFLAWQSKTTLDTQIGGLIYAVPCFLLLIFATTHRED